MTIIPFLVIAAVSGTGSLVFRASRGWASVIAVVGLVAMAAVATAMNPGATAEIGGTALTASAWLRLYAILASVVAIGLVLIDATAHHEPDVPGVLVLGIGSAVLALALPEAGIAVLAVAAGGLAGVLVAAPLGAAARAAFVGTRELRALAIATALAIVAAAWVARPVDELVAQPTVFGLAYLAFGTAVAIRFGAIPFHLWAARVADAAPGAALPLLMAWGPAAFAAVAFAWIGQSVAPLTLPLGAEQALIAAIGVVSIVLGLVAALIQDDLEHVLGYSIVAEAGVAVLALAVLDPAGWEPARSWLLVFVVGRSAFAAWVVAIHGGFGTRRLPELTGWARRAPLLAISLVAIAAASIAWPGLLAWEARSSLISLALPRAVAVVVTLVPIGALAIYARILLRGVAQPAETVTDGRGERPRWPAPVPRRPIVGLGGVERGFERAGHALSGFLDVVWLVPSAIRLNRMPLAAVVVLLLSGLAFLVAGGGLGVAEAARVVPLPTASPGVSGPTPSSPTPSGAAPTGATPSVTTPSLAPSPAGSRGPGGSAPASPSFAPVP